MMNARQNKKGMRRHETEWGEPENCVAIAKWSGRDVITLHTETDRWTIIPYTPNAIETKTVAKLTSLKWTCELSRGKHCKYLIHNGIHYNALKMRDSQEGGEQNKESNNKELSCVREGAFVACIPPPSPCVFSSEGLFCMSGVACSFVLLCCVLLVHTKENIHKKEDEMWVTQDNIKEEIHEEHDEIQTTNAPCRQVCGSDTKDKTNEKGKRKSDKREALCQAEHRKTKQKIDTKAWPTKA